MVGYRDYIQVILGLYWDNGKENGNCDYRDSTYGSFPKYWNPNIYYRGNLPYWGYIGIMKNKMETIRSIMNMNPAFPVSAT